MPCKYCVAGFHELCEHPTPLDEVGIYASCCCYDGRSQERSTSLHAEMFLGDSLRESLESATTRKTKSGDTLRDVISTGRKRAAIAKPFVEGAICEWAGLKFAGGGVKPIIGCTGTVLMEARGKYARHHGPDKNVLNNELTNLHLICVTCHNRWHTLNDPFYGDGTGESRPPAGESWLPNGEWKAHDPETKATPLEILNNEINWQYNPQDREDNAD